MVNHCIQQLMNAVHNHRLQHYNVGDVEGMLESIKNQKIADHEKNFL